MQTVTVEGYLATDPSILAAQGSGRKRASFRLIETARYRRGDGQMGERTTGFNCVCFNEATADSYIGAFAKKGARVVVSGHVENDTWTGRDGAVHYDLRLVVEDLRLKSRRQDPAPQAHGDGSSEEPVEEAEAMPF
jgi:single-stranded DNA-binding protein